MLDAVLRLSADKPMNPCGSLVGCWLDRPNTRSILDWGIEDLRFMLKKMNLGALIFV
ncbi:MAG: hypothetical protein WBA89_01600 [Microcoleus sp.]|uniref:hypothetical protein n=1 Tax=Microcoleus sp. TaxID=44472 RepID=UPI003C73508F